MPCCRPPRSCSTEGFHATSLDDIAARLNVSKPTLYHYVKNKDEILLQCVRQGLEMTLEGIEASRQAGGNAVDQLRACMQAYANIVMQPFGMCLIRVGDEEVPEPSRSELRRMKSEIDLAFRRLVAQGCRRIAAALRPQDDRLCDCWRFELDRPLVPARRRVHARADRRAVHCHAVRGCCGGPIRCPPRRQARAQAGRTASESGGEHRRQGPTDAVFAATRGRRRAQALPVAALTCRGLKQLLDLAVVKHAIRPCAWMSVNGDPYNRAAGMAPCSVRCCTISSMNCSWLCAGRACCNQVGKCRREPFAVQSDQGAHEHRQAGVQCARALQVAVRAARFVQQGLQLLQVGSGQG